MKQFDKMTTPLSRVRGLGSAKSGTGHFFQQRLTAIANLPLSLLVIYVSCKVYGVDYAIAKTFIGQPVIAIGLILALLSFTWHMRLGMQIVIEDYVHGEGGKVVLVIFNTLLCLALFIAGTFSLLKISFGA
jgi:succinate dehydrogenase / fumarate reductase, membrane anchor subunit